MLTRIPTIWALAATLAIFGTFSGIASAQDTASGGYKIGVVDVQYVISNYEKRASKYRELEQEVERLQSDIDAISNRIEANRQRYEEGADTMSEDERFALKQQIDRDYTEYRSELERRQREIDRSEETVLREVIDDVNAAIANVAKEGNFHLVLNAASGPRSAVLYHDTTIEITSQVLAALNN